MWNSAGRLLGRSSSGFLAFTGSRSSLGPFSDSEGKLARRLHSPAGQVEYLPPVLTMTIIMGEFEKETLG